MSAGTVVAIAFAAALLGIAAGYSLRRTGAGQHAQPPAGRAPQ